MNQALSAHLPALQVIVPLLAAPLCFLLRRPSLAWPFAFVVTLCTFAAAIALFNQTADGTVLSYHMGGWEPPWGIEYRIDRLSSLVLLLVSGMAAIAMLYAGASVAEEVPRDRQILFYTAFLLCLAGLLGMTITGDAFNLFVFLEISSLSTYILISFGRDRRALTSAFQYLIMGTIGATMLLIGIGFIYMMTGTLNMADLAERLPPVYETKTVRAAFAFIVIGLSIKLALFPLHIWLPNAYSFAPSVLTVFLAGTATKVALYALIRFVYTIFGGDFAFGQVPLQYILLSMAVLAVFSGSLYAVFQASVKHALAYSSIAQIGYMVIGVGLFTVAGMSAGLLHLFNHAIMKGCLFMAVGCVYLRYHSVSIETFKGLGRTMPWTMAAFVIGGLGLIGMPLTSGFVSKWYLVLAALDHGWGGFVLIATIMGGSLLAVAYVWRIVEAAYFQDPENDENVEAPLSLLVPTWILALATIYFGIDTHLPVNAATGAALDLLGGTQ